MPEEINELIFELSYIFKTELNNGADDWEKAYFRIELITDKDTGEESTSSKTWYYKENESGDERRFYNDELTGSFETFELIEKMQKLFKLHFKGECFKVLLITLTKAEDGEVKMNVELEYDDAAKWDYSEYRIK